MKKKLLNQNGETLVEVLVALLIVAVCFVMLQGAIVASARLNNTAEQENVPFLEDGATSSSCKVTIKRSNDSSSSTSKNTNCYTTNGGEYVYYEN